jgi:predicted dinucleotide-binding enzyme
LKIGIIGTGRMAGSLGKQWIGKGHELLFGSRDTDKGSNSLAEVLGTPARVGTLTEAAEFGDVLVLAIPHAGTSEAVRAAGTLTGKIVIDCTNPVGRSSEGMYLTTGGTTSAAEEIAKIANGAKVIKAFNTNFSPLIRSGGRIGKARSDSFYCGDDKDAKENVAALIEDAGFHAVDVGPLSMARYLEPFALMIIQLKRLHVGGQDVGYQLLVP